MSWQEKIKADLTIQTGDGEKYTFLWLNGSFSREFNIAEFQFIEVEGTLAKRKLSKGRRYPLECYFQGESHLDFTALFDKSSLDPRPWKVSHPFYGNLVVQPASLNYDNSVLNITKITGTLVETIAEEFPRGQKNPIDVISIDVATVDSLTANAYANNISPKAADITQMKAINKKAYTDGSKYVNGEFAESYFNAFNTADGYITNATDEPLTAMRTMQRVINAPALFSASANSRLGILQETYTALRGSIGTTLTRNQKFLFQTMQATSLTAMAQTVSTPLHGDFQLSTETLGVIDVLTDNYNQFLSDLASLQTANNGAPDSFIPDASGIAGLNNLFNFTLTNLFGIALAGKQERSIVLEEDSNWILLAHRFYGLQPDGSTQSTVQQLIQQNGAGISEMLRVRKNRLVKYYV